MKKIRLTNKLQLGFLSFSNTTTIAVVGAVAIFFIFNMANYCSYKDKVSVLMTKANEINMAQSDFMLRDVLDTAFYETGKTKNTDLHEVNIKDITVQLNEFKTISFLSDDVITKEIDALLADYASYNKNFDELIDLQLKVGYMKYGAIGDMRKSINSVEQFFKEQNTKNKELEISLLKLRRHEKDFLLRRDDASLNKFNAEFDIMQALVEANVEKEQRSNITILLGKYKSDFLSVVAHSISIFGNATDAGLLTKTNDASKNVIPDLYSLQEDINKKVASSQSFFIVFYILFALTGIIVAILMAVFIIRNLSKSLDKTKNVVRSVAEGALNIEIAGFKDDEFGDLAKELTVMNDGLKAKSAFAAHIGKGELDAAFEPVSEHDELGVSLLDMQHSLQKAEQEDEIRKQEDDRRNWSTAGFAKFGEILRQNNDNLHVLSFNIIRNLVEYTGMNQGGMFVLNDTNAHHHLELTACYAYSRQKFMQKTIEIGEGLVGACFQEGATIYLTDVPNNYVAITSGLGDANPSCILIVPLKLNDQIFGILELASFKLLEKHEIEFVERVCESIASTISSVKVNVRTAHLLEISQQQEVEMRAQEEEMRQNMEEMHATQEELQRKEQMTAEMVERMRVQEAELKVNLAEMSEKEKYTQDLIETMKQQEEELRQNMEEVHATQEELGRKDYIQQEEIKRLNAENELKMQAIAVKEKEMRGVLETSLDGVIIIDEKGTMEFFNHSAEKLWGYTSNEVIGKNVNMLMGMDHAPKHDGYLNNYVTTGLKKIIGSGREVDLKMKNGTMRSVFLSVVETKVDGKSKFTSFVKDLSEQKRIEEERTSLMERALSKEFEFQKKIDELEKALKSGNASAATMANTSDEKLMEWNDTDFSVEVSIIDDQHKQLVALINNLYDAFRKGEAKGKLKGIVDELINYTSYHFGVEEKYFADFNFVGTAEHLAEHKKFVDAVLAFKADFETGKVTVSYDVLSFLKDWLIHHIQGTDRKYTACFHEHGLSSNSTTSAVVVPKVEAPVAAKKEEVKVNEDIDISPSLMAWTDDEFSVSVAVIDAQHKRLVDLINGLYNAFKKGEAKSKLNVIIEELINYTASHFGTEEKYFAEFKYSDTDDHVKEHKNFVDAVLAFKADFDSGKVSVSYDLLNFLRDWLLNHIQGTDRAYTALFNENGLK